MSKEQNSRCTDSAKKRVKRAIKGLDRLILAYSPCKQMESGKGCEVCSARHAPVLGMTRLRAELARK